MRIIGFIFLFLTQANLFAQYRIPYYSNNKWGYADKKGNIIIKPKYSFVSENTLTKALRVKKGNKYFYIDNDSGKKLFKQKFDSATDFSFGQAFVSAKGKRYTINLDGEKIPGMRYCSGAISINGYFFGYKRVNNCISYVIYSSYNQETINTYWSELIENYQGIAFVKKDSLWGIINSQYELIYDYKFDNIIVNRSPKNNPITCNAIYKMNNKYGVVSYNGKIITEAKYDKISFYSEYGLAKVWLNSKLLGYIDKTGQEYFD